MGGRVLCINQYQISTVWYATRSLGPRWHKTKGNLQMRLGVGPSPRNGFLDDIPRFLISTVHPVTNSCTSSGSTEGRAQPSVHLGFAGC